MFHFSLGKHITLLRPLLEFESCNKTGQKWNAFAVFFLHNMFGQELCRAHEQVTCISYHHGVALHIWQKEVNLIGNVTSPDRMSTKTLSFPNRYFSDKLCFSCNGVCFVVIFKASKHLFVARLFYITLF